MTDISSQCMCKGACSCHYVDDLQKMNNRKIANKELADAWEVLRLGCEERVCTSCVLQHCCPESRDKNIFDWIPY